MLSQLNSILPSDLNNYGNRFDNIIESFIFLCFQSSSYEMCKVQYNFISISLSWMSQEDHIPSQKSMSEQKQTNSIRKITIETLSPIITKLEEHITYLLQQTSKLRMENAKLSITTASQQALEKQFDLMSQDMDKLSAKMNALNKDKQLKLKEQEIQIHRLAEELEFMMKGSEFQSKQIDQISKNNGEYLSRIDQNKEEQLQSIEQLKSSIENYYEQEMIKIESIREQFEDTKHAVSVLQEKRMADQQQIKQIMNITSLYEAERGDIRKMIEKGTYLENNVVMLADYQKDRKFQRLDNEQTKSDIRAMLDEALTPQIRKFLPQLISKLNDLNQFQSTLAALDSKLRQTKQSQEAKLQQMANNWQDKFTKHEHSNEKAFGELNKKINKNLEMLDDRIQANEEKTNGRLKSIEQDLPKLQKRWKSNLSQSISKMETDLKEYLNVWGEQFLDRKKDNIYQLVQTQKPPEQHQEEQKVQQLVFSMEPLLNSVKEQLKLAQNQVQSSKQTLYERLSFFNNQIVKMKSDITKQTTQNKRMLDTFNFKLIENKDTCDQMSLLISKLIQTAAISYALSLDQSFLHRDHEVYVTYNDGIIMEVTDNGHINYRRQEYVPELLKRAVLTELVRTIDNTIVGRPLLNWNKSQNKPSHLSPSIQNTYQSLLQENKIVPIQKNSNKHSLSDRKSLDSRHANKKQYQSHHLSKLSPNNDIFSKTIDPDGHDFRTFNSATRYDVGHEQNREYTSRRTNVKLKKIEKKQH